MMKELMSGAIATLGIGAQAGANGLSRATSAGGKMVANDLNKASSKNSLNKNGDGKDPKSDGGAIYKAASNIGNAIKGKFSNNKGE